MKENDVIPD